MRTLKDLYNLLYNHIQNIEIMGLLTQTSNMMHDYVITFNEKESLDTDIIANKKPLERNKELVVRRIKELTPPLTK